jgi:hypothetical protein
LRESFFILFEQDAYCKDKTAAVSINKILNDIGELFFEKQLAILFECCGLEQDLAKGYPVILLLHFCSILVKVVYIFFGIY